MCVSVWGASEHMCVCVCVCVCAYVSLSLYVHVWRGCVHMCVCLHEREVGVDLKKIMPGIILLVKLIMAFGCAFCVVLC